MSAASEDDTVPSTPGTYSDDDPEGCCSLLDEFDEHNPRLSPSSSAYAKRSGTYNYEKTTSSRCWSWRGVLEFLGFCILLVATLHNKPEASSGEEDISSDNKESLEVVETSTVAPVNGKNMDYGALVASYRQRAGDISVELMLEELELRKQGIKSIDISKMVDLIDEALDTVGLRSVYDEVFTTYALTVALNDGLARRQISPNKITAVIKSGAQGPGTHVNGRFPGQERGEIDLPIQFWWPHWVGAVTADKLLRDGSLKVSADSEERIDAVGYFQEIYQMTSARKYPDIHPYHAVHGFWWQYIAQSRPDLTEYPEDLYLSFCEPWIEELDFNDHVQNSMYRECRHGIGHAIFYTMILREDWVTHKLDVRKQFLDKTFIMSDKNFCEAERICEQATEEEAKSKCHGGLHHSISIFNPDKDDSAADRIKAVCGEL